MGKLAAETGWRVILSSYVIEHRIGSQGFRGQPAAPAALGAQHAALAARRLRRAGLHQPAARSPCCWSRVAAGLVAGAGR